MSNNTFYNKLINDYDPTLSHSGVNGKRLAKRLHEISRIGALDNQGVTRIGYSNEEKQAKSLVIEWMHEAGLEVTTDGAGNVFGRLEGKNNDAPAIMSGSHLDSVPNGGNFDGPLGVLAALEVAEAWKDTGFVPPLPYEIAIFSDEEGSRFQSGLTGSRAFMGKITDDELDTLVDDKGLPFDEVIKTYDSNREKYLTPYHRGKNIGMFVEVHIEQGKVLEENNQPVGIVTGIAGLASMEVSFLGEAGHAGNTPMKNRKDPVVAAGMFVSEVEKLPCQVSSTAVATIGKLNVFPNGSNVIAKEVKLAVDIRDIKEDTRDKLLELIYQKAESIAAEREIDVTWSANEKITPLPISNELQDILAGVIADFDMKPIYIPSGAGHDTMALGEKFSAAMIFVRSKDGLSHRPDEWTSLNDCVTSVHILKNFIQQIMVEKN